STVKTVVDPNTKGLMAVDCGLAALFKPKTVGLVGATERVGSVGHTVMVNLMRCNGTAQFPFTIFPVNPTRDAVCGHKCYKSVADCPVEEGLDVVFVVTPAKTVVNLAEVCGKAGVKVMVIITAGFKEIGEEGLKMELAVADIAKQYSMRVVGPNCLGVMSPNHGLNGTFAATDALPGSLAFISQSGAMCTAALDWSIHEKVGFSAFVSIGNMAEVSWGDIIYYLGEDPKTSAILIYMESIGDVRKFMSAAKTVSKRKPIIVLKAGKSDEAAAAAASHTGSLAGSHDAFIAAMKRVGVLVVDCISELFDCALFLDKQPRPAGPRLMIITNAGGPGVLSTDATSCGGCEIAELEPEIVSELDSFLPSAWSRANPIDVLGDAGADIYTKTLEVAMKSKNCDGVLVILSPQSVTEPLATAQSLADAVAKMKEAGNHTKPVIASWMGGQSVLEGFHHLNSNGVPTFRQPDDAARTYCQVYKQTRDWHLVNDYVELKLDQPDCDNGVTALEILKAAQDSGRDILSEDESKNVLKSYGVPIADTIVCTTAEEAAAAGQKVLFPCVLKLHSKTITHKSDVGGVLLNVKDAEACKAGFETIKANCAHHVGVEHFEGVTVQPMLDLSAGIELLLGAVCDNQFGPMVVFGFGGCMVEIFKDTCTAIPPLTVTTAKMLVESTKIHTALKGVGNARFPGVDMTKVYSSLVQFSQMVCSCSPYVSELEINPLLALKDRVVALDARIVLRKKDEPVPELVIRPYPTQYITKHPKLDTLPSEATIRPIGGDDFDLVKRFMTCLSEETKKNRYFNEEEVHGDEAINSFISGDYSNQIALVYCFKNEEGQEEIAGVIRFWRLNKMDRVAECKYVVADKYQGKGVGRALMDAGRSMCLAEGIERIDGLVRDDRSQRILQKAGWTNKGDACDGMV
ncbi:MAG: hypothetical protein KVP17_003597, partial [Porospora cf. gigantea B]|uniref:uncharacterized protein n=2 Tax=Porospora cf. gigantea B TaxID=2853592 RepID=UPI003571DC16